MKFGGESEPVTDAPTEIYHIATISLKQNALLPVHVHMWLLDPWALLWTLRVTELKLSPRTTCRAFAEDLTWSSV